MPSDLNISPIGILLICSLLMRLCMSSAHAATIYVSTRGNDPRSGRLPEPNADGTDGPPASLQQARLKVRELTKDGKRVSVLVRGGKYFLRETAPRYYQGRLCLGPEDLRKLTEGVSQ